MITSVKRTQLAEVEWAEEEVVAAVRNTCRLYQIHPDDRRALVLLVRRQFRKERARIEADAC